MKTLNDLLSQAVLPTSALVRVDYNVSVGADGTLSPGESFRIFASLPTIKSLMDANIQPIVVSHFGRAGELISILQPFLEKLFPVVCVSTWDPYVIRNLISASTRKTVIVLPNSRSHPGEESADPAFAQLLSEIAPVYINDAFSASHRNHATITGVPKLLPSFAGKRLISEIEHLTFARSHAAGAVVIIGGAKFDTKIALIAYYLQSGSRVCVVGALAHAVYAARGYAIGRSFIDTTVDVSAWAHHASLWVPETVVVRSSTGVVRTCTVTDVEADEQIVDAGLQSVAQLGAQIVSAPTVIWNGPLGLYEDGFLAGTNEVKKYMIQSNAFRVVGGGDTLACIDESERSVVANFCSTGGGAMLDFLSTGTLVGIDALG